MADENKCVQLNNNAEIDASYCVRYDPPVDENGELYSDDDDLDENYVEQISNSNSSSVLYLFKQALNTTKKWTEICNAFTNFFYPNLVFQLIKEKVVDPKQFSCVPFVLLSIFTTDIELLNDMRHPTTNLQYKFIHNLQTWLRISIEKLNRLLTNDYNKNADDLKNHVEKSAFNSFDDIIIILSRDNQFEENLAKPLLITDVDSEQDQAVKYLLLSLNNNEPFFQETISTTFSKFNNRKRILEQYARANWYPVVDYMDSREETRNYLCTNTLIFKNQLDKALDEIACDFKQVEQTHSNQKQSIQKICDDGIREVEIEIDKAEQRQQEVKKQANNRVSNLLDQYHNMDEHTFLEKFQRDLNKHNTEQNTSGENFVNDDQIQIIARDLFLKIDQRMTAVHFKDFPILFDEFFG